VPLVRCVCVGGGCLRILSYLVINFKCMYDVTGNGYSVIFYTAPKIIQPLINLPQFDNEMQVGSS
jgi:hypothetical protein